MRRRLLFLSLALAAVAHPADAADKKPPSPGNPAVLARAGEIIVAPDEFVVYAEKEKPGLLSTMSLEQRRGLLEKLVVRKALAAKGEKDGLGSDPVVARELMKFKARAYPDVYWQREVDAKVKLEDVELWKVMDPQERLLMSAMVFGLDEEGHQDALEVSGLLAKGGDFAQLARERSHGMLASRGGDMGWQELPNKFVEEQQTPMVRATRVGGVTTPLETQIGWVIFQVRDRRTADDIFREKKDAARQELLPGMIAEARDKRLQELRAKAKITYPEKDPFGGPRPPVVVIDDTIFYEDSVTQESQHGTSSVSTPQQRLAKFIDVFLLMREVERLGLDQKEPQLRHGLSLARMETLSQLTLRRETENALTISDADLRAEYRRYYVPEVYELQVVVVQHRAQAEQALQKIKGGADFATVANENNGPLLQKQGGRLPPGPLSDYPAHIRSAVEAVPDGGITGVLEVAPEQFMVVKRLEKRITEVPAFELLADQIRRRLVIRRRADVVEEYSKKFRAGLKITVDEGRLRSL